EISKERVNIYEVFNDIFEIINYDLHNEVILEKHYESDVAILNIDKIKIEQVFLNIINNSLASMESLSSEPKKIIVTTNRFEEFFYIAIQDNGEGIKQELTDKCFDPFFTTKKKGVGLGLFICQSIIEAHNGEIYIDPEVDRGTKVCIKLPCLDMIR